MTAATEHPTPQPITTEEYQAQLRRLREERARLIAQEQQVPDGRTDGRTDG